MKASHAETWHLSEPRMEMARRIAVGRNSPKLGRVRNKRETKRASDYEINFVGACAEIAVCDRFQFPVDPTFCLGGDKGAPDLYVGDMGIEVKAATHYPPILKFNRLGDWKPGSMAVVLCHINNRAPSVVNLCGVVFRQEFFSDHFVEDFGYGPRFCFSAADMAPVKVLDEMDARIDL